MVLNGYSRFPSQIGTAPVYDLEAHRVGLPQKLLASPDGQPTGIDVWLMAGRTLSVSAFNVSYDEQRNTVTIGFTDTQLGLDKPAGQP